MISVVEGTVGSGKTYWCVRYLVRHLQAGGICATNLVLHPDALRRACGRRISSRQLLVVSADTNPSTIPRGDLRGHGNRRVVVVLDEALNWFSSSVGKDDPRKESWSEWLRQSDKLGQDVFFVAQRFERAAKWIRELAQLVVSVRNLGQTTVLGLPLGRLLCLRWLSVAVTNDVSLGQRTGADFYSLHPEIWNCYETSSLYGFSASDNAYDSLYLWPRHPRPLLAFTFLGLWSAWGFLRYAFS